MLRQNLVNVNEDNLAQQTSEKVALISLKCREMKKRIKALELQNQQLEEEKQEVTENYNRLLAEFNVYKESMMLLKASGDKGQALKFINQMVREIDKCIALLNK